MQNLPEYMNFKQAMKYLGIGGYDTLHSFIDEGLKVIVVRNIKRISKTDADKFMHKHSKKMNYWGMPK
ncbi:DNA-binding protein [Bombilactobacillus bombi]|uniref:DNA-binding protein n=1 Tax=Bombilactobacillus bombi TaxID=1303590 RepID=A0A417Z827_9LACO|nr:DNA-binding protein [Bombilactobacillus bombi]RHW46792.1 DNA-binding protein [Bombilactobacillus bombi]